MKILTIIGARPQFIKSAPVSKALKEHHIQEILVHTGQHYDHNMSQIFFDEMGLPKPTVNLNVGSGKHGWQTAQMLIQIEALLFEHQPDCVVVYGDTNSTLAGALASVKLHIPIAHIEAGLRSFNRTMPEEHNRVLTDHCADMLFCPTQTAVDLLAKEGIEENVFLVGDTMYDALRLFSPIAEKNSNLLETLNIEPQKYLLATIHRPYNTDVPENMYAIWQALAQANEPVILPIHPRTRHYLPDIDAPNIHMIDPVGYLDMLTLEKNARMIVTDSGGVQKEAYLFQVPCVTLRPETEWIETLTHHWNILVGADKERILNAIHNPIERSAPYPFFGDGYASQKITSILLQHFTNQIHNAR